MYVKLNLPILPPFPLGNHTFVFYICDTVFCKEVYLYHFFYTPHINDIICHLSFSFCLFSLSMTVSRSIHIAANGIFHSFLWLSIIPLSNILLYIWAISSLSIQMLLDICIASISWQL